MTRYVCRFSCGAASAVATKLTLARYAADHDVVIHYSDTRSEHPDNERFLRECEAWFGRPVERLTSERYHDVWDVWTRRRMLVSGQRGFAPCTEEFWRATKGTHQIGLFDQVLPQLPKGERAATPVQFRDLLISIARTAKSRSMAA